MRTTFAVIPTMNLTAHGAIQWILIRNGNTVTSKHVNKVRWTQTERFSTFRSNLKFEHLFLCIHYLQKLSYDCASLWPPLSSTELHSYRHTALSEIWNRITRKYYYALLDIMHYFSSNMGFTNIVVRFMGQSGAETKYRKPTVQGQCLASSKRSVVAFFVILPVY